MQMTTYSTYDGSHDTAEDFRRLDRDYPVDGWKRVVDKRHLFKTAMWRGQCVGIIKYHPCGNFLAVYADALNDAENEWFEEA
jgi:hypothetical protein